jgi:hypothetical protein
MNTLKNIKLSGILTPSQMINVKGGADSCGTVTDDKRRDRPGGGITTL